ncbi:MAG: ATP-dependent Clp protease proteolytic subunit [Candidatus Micrarchaeia archaeon]|jgi:membrane-bound ClpP family serine protease
MPLNFAAGVLGKRKEELLVGIKQEGTYSEVLHINGQISKDLATLLYEFLNNNTYPPDSRVLVSINSAGGDPDATYQIYKLLKSQFTKVDFAVPRFAKSAATLLALSGDNLLMSRVGELGPLDIQLEVSSGFWISGNSVRDSINMINELYSENPEVAKEWLKQLNPIVFSELDRKNEITEEYANKMWNLPDKKKAIKALVEKYPHHGYVIDIDEVQELGFKVEKLEGNKKICDSLMEIVRIDNALAQLGKISKIYEMHKDDESEPNE